MSTVIMHSVVSVDGFIADAGTGWGRCSTGTATATSRSPKAVSFGSAASRTSTRDPSGTASADPHVVIQGDRVLHGCYRVR